MTSKQPQPNPNPDRPAGVAVSPPPPVTNVVRQAKQIIDARQSENLELIHWFDSTVEVPVDGRDVLVRIEKLGRVITWFGYWDRGTAEWRDSDGYSANVTFWTHIPEGPQ